MEMLCVRRPLFSKLADFKTAEFSYQFYDFFNQSLHVGIVHVTDSVINTSINYIAFLSEIMYCSLNFVFSESEIRETTKVKAGLDNML